MTLTKKLDEKFDYLLNLCQQAKREIKECKQIINERRKIRIDFENKVKELEEKLKCGQATKNILAF